MLAANDNAPPAGRLVRIVGRVVDDGRVTITDLTWRPPQAASSSAELLTFPNDPREP